jgi:DNA-binding MarR family transcriptional regulator
MQDDGQTLAPVEEFHSLAVRRLLSRHGRLWTQQVSTDHTSIQFGLLLCLSRSTGGLTQSEIADRLAVDRATLTELVHRMSAQGHVTVSRDPRDGRRRVAALTDSGRGLLLELYRPALEVNKRLFSPLTAEEAEQLTGLLQRVLAHDAGSASERDPA